MPRRPLHIGLSASLLHEDPSRELFGGKPLFYLERSMAAFVGSEGDLPWLIPPASGAPEQQPALYMRYAEAIDGLVLTGGVDVAPSSYGQSPVRPEWAGDAVRDHHELLLLRAMLALDKPVLAICRGHQLLNVALGGTLYQDIATFVPGALTHRDPLRYDRNQHGLRIEPGSALAGIVGVRSATVNSVHHQAIDTLGTDLQIEARAEGDDIIEAVVSTKHRWVRGVQWHPEFRFGDPALLDARPLLASFLSAAHARR